MERPTGVTIIAVLYFLGAACLGLAGLAFIVGGSVISAMARSGGPGAAILAAGGVLIGGVCLFFAILDGALGVGFIKLQNWARVVAIVLTVIGVLFGLLGLMSLMVHLAVFALAIRLIVLAIQIWILVYLFRSDVKQAFGATSF